MESLLTRLVTYKLMDGSRVFSGIFNQPTQKVILAFVLFISIIGSSFYIIRRKIFQSKSSSIKSDLQNKLTPQDLVDIWVSKNQRLCGNMMDLCAAFVNNYADRVKAPSGIRKFAFLPQLSSPVLCSQKSQPIAIANVITVPVLVSANRLSFSGERQGIQSPSYIKFSLSNFSLEVILNLSFSNTDILSLRGVSTSPQFSLSIESSDPLENAKHDIICLIEDIVANLPLIYKNAEPLLLNSNPRKDSVDSNHSVPNMPPQDAMEKAFEATTSLDLPSTSLDHSETTSKSIDSEINPSIDSRSSLPDESMISGIPLKGALQRQINFSSASESEESTEIASQELVVLAHNPSLKQKLDGSFRKRRHHQRSASDVEDEGVPEALPMSTPVDDAGPVPLDPIVHPREELQRQLQENNKMLSPRPSQRSLKKDTDISPVHERVAPNLASKNLLVKVVKADFIELKSSSDAYCVVELDEPYQRHATHVVPPSEQLFWDQHLLFGLNSNSKRAVFEVFELSKRRKSISRGYAEVYLPDLLTSTLVAGGGGCPCELLRCIPLDAKQHSASTSGLGSGGGGGGGKWEFGSTPASSAVSLNLRKPTITAEFHFMERIVDDPFSVCKGRLGVGSPMSLNKLHAGTFTSPASSSDSSLSQTAGVTSDATAERASHHGSKEGMAGSDLTEHENPKDLTPTPNTETSQVGVSGGRHESRLERSTSIRGSRLFEPAFENLRMAELNAALSSRQAQPHPRGSGSAFGASFRRKSVPRLGNGGGGSGGGSAPPSAATVASGFGLLGPSSQLAGVVAGLTAASVESAESSVDPSTAAAVAAAVAVAAATGRSTSASAPLDRRSLVAGGDSLFEGGTNATSSMATLGSSEHEPATETVVRYAAPAANVAESLGTYSVQPPLRRADTGGGAKLMNLFKSKKKHTQPSGMARLLYLQNLEVSEFDAISTEGYQRIVQGDRIEKP